MRQVKDTLLDGPNAPLSNFSSRIDFAFRIGIISHQLARDIHIIRKIRNDFAHSYEPRTFEDGKIRDQVNALAISVNLKRRGQLPYVGTKGDFIQSSLYIIGQLRANLANRTLSLTPATEEGIYFKDHM